MEYQRRRKNVREGAFVEVRYGGERCIKIERSAACGEFLPRGKTHALIILEAAEKWRMIILERWNGFGSGKQRSGDGTKLENGRQILGTEQCSRAEDDFGAADGTRRPQAAFKRRNGVCRQQEKFWDSRQRLDKGAKFGYGK